MKHSKQPMLKAIHIYNSLQPTRKPKIAKEYVLPMLKTKLNGKSQLTTMYKNNSGLIAKTK